MCRTKSTARRSYMVAAKSCSSEDDISLGANQEEAHAPSPVAVSSSAETACLHSGMSSPASTRHSGRTTFQCKFVSIFFNYNIIYEKLINILLIYFIFRFTNIEAARVITLAFKSSMEILLFQWSQLSRHPDWRPYINPWFQRFQVGINF